MMMSIEPWRGAGRRVLAVAFILACAVSMVAGSDEPSAANTTPEPQAAPAQHVTKSLRIKAPSVAVRANPSTPQKNHHGTGQTAFLDENGQLTSEPPADFEFPVFDTTGGAAPAQTRSAVDPNAVLVDTTHIRAVMRATVNEQGSATIQCNHSTDSTLQKACTQSHAVADQPVVRASGVTAKEDGQ
jgi:hypothetical protein